MTTSTASARLNIKKTIKKEVLVQSLAKPASPSNTLSEFLAPLNHHLAKLVFFQRPMQTTIIAILHDHLKVNRERDQRQSDGLGLINVDRNEKVSSNINAVVTRNWIKN
jgi:hypothetical protein